MHPVLPVPLSARTLRLPAVAAVAAIALGACSDAPTAVTYGGGDYVESVEIGPNRRYYRVHVPPTITPDRPAPLILAFHGVGINSAQMEGHTGLDSATDEAGMIVVYPESSVGAWDVAGELAPIGLDDREFTERIIDRVSDALLVDRDRVLAVGLSNGALFVQRLGCVLADRITGFVSVSGTMPRRIAAECFPARPISALYVLGTDDTFFPIEGNDDFFSAGGSVAFWAERNGCTGTRQTEQLPDTAMDGTVAFRSVYAQCTTARVELDSIAGAGHGWPGALRPLNPEVIGVTSRNLSANHRIVRFLESLHRE